MILKTHVLGIFFGLILFFSGLKAFTQKPLNPKQDIGPKSKIELIKADSLAGTSGLTQTRTFIGNVQFRHRGVDMFCQKAVHFAGENNLKAYGKIYINQGDTLSLTGDTLYYSGDARFAKVFGKEVVLKDDSTTLTSTQINYNLNTDLAYYPKPGVVERDSSILSSNTGYYNTKNKQFRYYGDVEIINPDYIICTDTLLYDSNSGLSTFHSPTTIQSTDGNLSADEGTYNLKTGASQFLGRSIVENQDYTLQADSLDYNTETQEGTGKGNVVFHSKKDKLYLYGDYGEKVAVDQYTKMVGNTITKVIDGLDTLYLSSDSVIIYNNRSLLIEQSNENSTLEFDSLYAQDSSSVVIDGLNALRDSIHLESDSTTNDLQLMDTSQSSTDSTFSNAADISTYFPSDQSDTLLETTTTSKDKVEFIIATGNVKIFRDDFQAICDSLNYDLVDSVISFFRDPIIWNKDSQLLADSVNALIKNNKIQEMNLNQNGFVISLDTAGNYNQIKGREIVAIFDSTTAISKVNVDGNGESVYYALDELNKIVALNKVVCSKMRLAFEQRKVSRITFLGRPESKFIPPVEIGSNTGKLDKFDWRIDEKPSKNEVIGSIFAP